jgi:hypothetical protein
MHRDAFAVYECAVAASKVLNKPPIKRVLEDPGVPPGYVLAVDGHITSWTASNERTFWIQFNLPALLALRYGQDCSWHFDYLSIWIGPVSAYPRDKTLGPNSRVHVA